MTLILSHITSIQLLSLGAIDLDDLPICPLDTKILLSMPPVRIPSKRRHERPRITAPNITELQYAKGLDASIAKPIHATVDSASAIRNLPKLVCHVDSKPSRELLFVSVGQGVYASIPELCFLQMAAFLPPIDLIALGYEMCGYYAAQASGFISMRRRRPLTTVDRLAKFLQGKQGTPGVAKARSALKHIIDGSASPAETILSMLLTLPHSMGGYGLTHPQLNHRKITARKRSADQTASLEQRFTLGASTPLRTTVICDLYWKDGPLDVEYDSTQEHSGKEAIEKDARRRNDIASSSHVLTATNKQLANVQLTNHLAKQIAKHIGARMRIRTRDFLTLQRDLRTELNRIYKTAWLKL